MLAILDEGFHQSLGSCPGSHQVEVVSARCFPKSNHEEFSEGGGGVDFIVYSSKKLLAHSIRRREEGRVFRGSDDFGSALFDAQECLQVVGNVAG